jgi:predicted Rossmann-fold nucleotide-binding protein
MSDAVFLGCRLPPDLLKQAIDAGALVFPRLEGVPYNPYRGALYTPEELMSGFEAGVENSHARTPDGVIYAHYVATGKAEPASILETLARRLHDHAVTDALLEFIEGRRVVAVMGGHALSRADSRFFEVARMARTLAREGFLVTSGGGPGAMEAAHLGAWCAGRPEEDLESAVGLLAKAPLYTPIDDWLDTAWEAREIFPAAPVNGRAPESLGIPTWYYGHEPSALFATHIAKYFANSVREDGLVTIAKHGVIYTPGSAGTIQEIFQDAVQNHYNTVGVISPMIFLGKDYWTQDKPVVPLLQHLARGRAYADRICITDDPGEVVRIVGEFAEELG